MTRRTGATRAPSRRPTLLSAAFVATVVLLLVGGSTTATVWVLRAPRPDALADAEPLTSVPVEPYAFADPRTVRVAVTTGEPQPLVTQASGTVTASGCLAGGTLDSGARVLEVDGAPVVGLATSVPLWRDLAAGDRGEDVRAVQDELTRLGLAPGTSGRVDRATVVALRTFARDRGVAVTSGGPVLPIAAVVWLPGTSVEVATCDVVRGGAVAAGDQVAEVAAPVVRAVATLPPGLVPGPRTLTVDGTVVQLGDDGEVQGADALAALAGTESHRAAREVEESGFSGMLALRDPLTVVAVPTAAVYGEDASGLACLLADGVERTVQVVSSELGQTLVTMAGEALDPPARADLPTDRGATCGSS